MIWLIETGLQIVIIFIGKSPFHAVNNGLTGIQWSICLGFSLVTFVVSIVTKLILVHICIDRYLDRKMLEEEERQLKMEGELGGSDLYLDKTNIGKKTGRITRYYTLTSDKKVAKDNE